MRRKIVFHWQRPSVLRRLQKTYLGVKPSVKHPKTLFMKAKLSDRIRPNSEVLPWIYEEIKLLENQLDEELTQIETMRVAIKEAQQALVVCATDEEVLDIDDLPTSSGVHMTPEQKEPFLDSFRVRCLTIARTALTKLQPLLNK